MLAQDAMEQDNSALLSDATMAALHLHHQPFTTHLQDTLQQGEEAALPFSDAITEEQLADIKQALITGDDLLLVLGEKGAGKTTLLQQLDANSGLRIQCFPVPGNERFKTANLFSGMLEAFHQEPPTKLKDLLDQLIPCLQSMVARNTLCTIVLDDAHTIDKAELTQLLSGMLYVNSQDETLLRITLAATHEFEDTIPELLPEGSDLPYSSLSIEGLSAPRAAAYLDYRLQLAGFDQEFPFTERDMDSFVEHSDGRPARLQTLTANVLNEKYGIADDMPSELMGAQSNGFLQSRFGKLALGALATLLIVGGLLMFMPNNDNKENNTSAALDTTGTASNSTSDEATQNEQQSSDASNNTSQSINSASTSSSTSDSSELADNALNTDDRTSVAFQETESAIVSEIETTSTDNAESPARIVEDTNAVVDVANTTIIQAPEQTQQAPESSSSNSADDDNEAVAPTTEDDNEPVASSTEGDNTQSDNESSAEADNAVVENTDEQNTEQTEELATDNQNAQADEAAQDAGDSAASGDSELANLLESPTWILVQEDEKYTIQLSASRDLESVESFLRRTPLPGPNSIFSFERNGDVWYALVHGTFDGYTEAQLYAEQLPESARRDEPWIRLISRVKTLLRQP